jgi:tetratricopeptide (TPR) repeat protein
VREELGVGFIVSGSVRRAGDRVRIAAHLVDATSGHQVWAQRYDRELDDVFALQDEISEEVVSSLEPALEQFQGERLNDRDPRNLDAWDRVQCGWWHLYRHSQDGAREAKACARRALELDGRFGPAYVLLAGIHAFEILYGWDETTAKALEKCQQASSQAIALDSQDPMGHFVLGMARSFAGEHEAAIVAHERALDLNPSLALAYWGLGVALGASELRPEEDGAGMIEKALRLSPQDPLRQFMLQNLGVARLLAGQYGDAADCARKSLQLQADQPHAWRLLAAACGYLGREAQAREALDRAFRLAPQSVEDLRLLNRPAVVEAILGGWRKGGWSD